MNTLKRGMNTGKEFPKIPHISPKKVHKSTHYKKGVSPTISGKREGKEKVRALLEEGYLNGPIKPNSKHDKRFLTPSQREALATKTGLTLAQVDTWLHNRWKRDPVKET